MIKLEIAYAAWRRQAFPTGSPVDALDELHADLVLADTWVAESVIPYVKRGIYSPARVDVLGTLSDLRHRAKRLAESVAGEDRDQARKYDEYAHLLEVVYEAFLRGGEEAPP
jgi:hypothetical protein